MKKVFEAKNLRVLTRESGFSASVTQKTDSNISSARGVKEILKGVSFEVLEGETVVLLGPNGAGKSTLLSAIMGDPRFIVSGEMRFFEKDLKGLSTDKRARLGIFMTFQEPVEISGVSTTEVLRVAAEEEKGGFVPLDLVREEISSVVEKLGQNIWFLEREANVGFSGGEKKKNEVIQLLSRKPKMILLDELDSGLDVDAAENISKVLADYKKETGCAVIIVTHNMRILKYLDVTKAVLLRKGEVFSTGDAGLVRKVERQGFTTVFNEISARGEGAKGVKK